MEPLATNEYQKFFEETPIALFRADIKTGNFTMANKFCAKLLGYENVDALAKANIHDIFSDKDYKKLLRYLRIHGFVKDYHIELNCCDETKIWGSVSLHINCDGLCLEGMMHDITDNKALESEVTLVKQDHLVKLAALGQKIEAVIDSYD